MSDINMGTLYDINKTTVIKEKPLSEKEIDEKLQEIKNFCILHMDQYYMLLNREKYDFTLFNLGEKLGPSIQKVSQIIKDDLKECLRNRGAVISIDLTKDKGAYEIWLKIDNEAFVYYFFPYDEGVIE